MGHTIRRSRPVRAGVWPRWRGWAGGGLLLVALCAGPVVPTHATELRSGIDRRGFDPQVRPQDDLFLAANGGWLKATPIPPDRAAVGVFETLSDQAGERVRGLCETLARRETVPGTPEQQVGDYYQSYLDVDSIDARGLAPLAPWLAEIDAVQTPAQLVALWGRWQGVVATPIGTEVDPDPDRPTVYQLSLNQDGLGLPDRDYYLKTGASFEAARVAYRHYLETLLQLAGAPEAAHRAQAVFALETRLARVQWSTQDSRNALKTHNPMDVATLTRRAPGLDWAGFLRAAAMPSVVRLSLAQPSYARALGPLLQAVPMATWRDHLRLRLWDAQARVLPSAWRDAEFVLRGHVLMGQERPRPRWQQATAAVDEALGQAVGRFYVERYFPPSHKARMQQMVARLLSAYRQSIDTRPWMSAATRQQARDKLARYRVKIGYPDRWRDDSALQVIRGDAFGNRTRAARHEHERWARRVGQPIDRDEWHMTPQTVNAYYDPSQNEIVFPAALIDAPLFDADADDAVNYGAIGATIGHEISHGFDDQGSRYDGEGRLRNWWTARDRRAFDALGDRLARQFDAYEPLPGHRVNGRLTLGENMADLSGLSIAYQAYQLSLEGRPAPVIDGLSGDERFFYGYAISWREQLRPQRLIEQLTSDEHAPSHERANGSVLNLDAFHRTFGTRPGDRLYKAPAQRIRIW